MIECGKICSECYQESPVTEPYFDLFYEIKSIEVRENQNTTKTQHLYGNYIFNENGKIIYMYMVQNDRESEYLPK